MIHDIIFPLKFSLKRLQLLSQLNVEITFLLFSSLRRSNEAFELIKHQF